MGDSLGFHIIFVMFGLTLPILVSWFELTGIRKKDKKYTDIAKFWSKIMAILVITGVISGTVVALQMTLVWPGILKFGGPVIGLPFMYETYAFLIEATFLGLYMMTWNNPRVSPMIHWLFGLGIIVGSTLSAFAITSIDAWMNLPTGFTIVHGSFANIDVIKAMFSETSIVEFIHSMPGYYVASSLGLLSFYAFKLFRMKGSERKAASHKMDWTIIQRLMVFATLALTVTIITADITGKYLAKNEPSKLATIELVSKTDTNVPFTYGGVQDVNGNITGPYVKIPDALSLLAGGSFDSKVTGLDKVAINDRPPEVIHTLFDIKLALVGLLTVMIAGYFAIKYFRTAWLTKRSLLMLLGIGGFMGIIIVELGWTITEMGRQPWAVRGYVTTADAVTKTQDITGFGYIFPAAFLLLFFVTAIAIRKITRDNTQKGKA